MKLEGLKSQQIIDKVESTSSGKASLDNTRRPTTGVRYIQARLQNITNKKRTTADTKATSRVDVNKNHVNGKRVTSALPPQVIHRISYDNYATKSRRNTPRQRGWNNDDRRWKLHIKRSNSKFMRTGATASLDDKMAETCCALRQRKRVTV